MLQCAHVYTIHEETFVGDMEKRRRTMKSLWYRLFIMWNLVLVLQLFTPTAWLAVVQQQPPPATQTSPTPSHQRFVVQPVQATSNTSPEQRQKLIDAQTKKPLTLQQVRTIMQSTKRLPAGRPAPAAPVAPSPSAATIVQQELAQKIPTHRTQENAPRARKKSKKGRKNRRIGKKRLTAKERKKRRRQRRLKRQRKRRERRRRNRKGVYRAKLRAGRRKPKKNRKKKHHKKQDQTQKKKRKEK